MERCNLCPRRCNIQRDEIHHGFCGLPEEMVIARIAPHLWEEPPISGQLGTGAIFFSGCTLRCVYCQNGNISHRNEGRRFTPAQLAEAMRRLVDAGMETISFITATPHLEGILQALALYRPPVPLVWNTSGYEAVDTLKRLEGTIDVYLPDLKHYSPAACRLCTGQSQYFPVAEKAIQEMIRQTGPAQYSDSGIMTRGTIIRHLIIPGLSQESVSLLDWIHQHVPKGVPVSLMHQYVPMNGVTIPGLNRRLKKWEYQRVCSHMESLGMEGFYQGKAAADEAFVPLFNAPESFI